MDDDNDPAPENIPTLWDEAPAVNDLFEGQSWGWDGIDQRVVAGGITTSRRSPIVGPPQGKSFIDLFLYFLPMVWFTNVVVAKTSNAV